MGAKPDLQQVQGLGVNRQQERKYIPAIWEVQMRRREARSKRAVYELVIKAMEVLKIMSQKAQSGISKKRGQINRLKYKDTTVFYRRKNMDFGMRYVKPVALPSISYETSYFTFSELKKGIPLIM